MRVALCLILTALVVAIQAQTESEKTAPLVVVKFNSGLYKEPSNLIRSVHDPDPPMNEPIRINRPPPRNEPQEIRNRRELNERTVDLRSAEINAALSNKKGAKVYFYHLEIKNIGTRKIKSFAWEYRSTGVVDISDRQFFCVVNAKPNDKKEIDLLTSLMPSRVVDAASAGQNPDKNTKGVVVINKVEYADGSTWVRRGWNPATFSTDFTNKVAAGNCLGL